VVGLDASFSWANLHGKGLDGYPSDYWNYSHQKNLGLFTGRVGWTYGQFLLYARGGYATANFDFRNDYPGNYTGSENMRGWMAGIGYEWMVWQNVSVFVEYDWLKLKKNHAELNGYFTDIDWTGDVVKAGFNWHLWTP
jgi:outer membrane immunogenic protein